MTPWVHVFSRCVDNEASTSSYIFPFISLSIEWPVGLRGEAPELMNPQLGLGEVQSTGLLLGVSACAAYICWRDGEHVNGMSV